MSFMIHHVRGNGDTPDPGTIGVYVEVRQLSDLDALLMWEDLITAPPEIQAFARIRMTALRTRLFGQDELRGAA